MIQRKVKEYLASDEFAQIVADEVQKQAPAAAARAVGALLSSKARKYLFAEVPHRQE